MAHVSKNFKSKKEFKEAVAAGKEVFVANHGIFPDKENGVEYIEGPWEYHKWYAKVQVSGGQIVKVIS